MSKLKLMIVMGTRPEIIKLSEIIKKCDKYFDLKIVHTGQNYDYNLNKLFFDELELREPDFYLGVVGENLGQTMGNVLSKSYELFDAEKPDAILVLGDTNSCLCVISAKRLKIPIFHLEAGNRCKDENLPEEVIRRIVDVTSDINLCYSENARRYILDQGVKPEYTYCVGSTMAEVLSANIDKINNSDVLSRLNLEPHKYILLSAHREENIDIESNFFSLMNAVNAMAEKYDMPILYSCHPRSKKYIEKRGFKFDPRVIQHEPLGFFDYNKLQQNAFCVVSDSGTIPEEGSYFKFPAVSIRTSTERPEAMDKGIFTIGSITSEYVLQAVDLAVSMWENGDSGLTCPAYSDENVSTKVVKIIQSYVGIVNKMIGEKLDNDRKEMREMPRVLVSTVAQWSDVGADTWSLLLCKYDVSKVASLYIRAAKSKSPMCHRYFHIFEDRVMKSIFCPSTKTGEEYRYVAGESVDTEEEVINEVKEANRYNQYRKHHSWIMYLAREIVWKFGHWKSRELDTFLDDFDPEVLVFPIESYIHLNRINRYIIEKKHPKVIGFFNDDNFTYKQGKGLGFKLRRFWLRKSVKWLVAHCDTVFAVCPKMKRECDEEFGINSIWLSKAMAVQNEFIPYLAGDPIRLCYTGKLYINRDKTLISLANAVHKINADRVRVVLDIFSTSALSEEVIRQLECDSGCHFRGAIPYSQVFDEQRKSDILLFVEDLSPDHLEARLSFSTKITDYFGSGKCLWAIGNADLGPIEYIKSQEAGLVSSTEDEILEVLKRIVNNPDIIPQYARNGNEIGRKYHNAELITATFMDAITN